ncbi:MAG: rRNA maturation RNase YbeY [bacterium]
MRLRIFKRVRLRAPRQRLTLLAISITTAEDRRCGHKQINLIFTSDQHIRSLNSRFRNRNRVTDVLSFDLGGDVDSDEVFGEIYISVPTARRQARQLGATITSEILRLTCHGLLHLFGYDHRRPTEAATMKNREDYYLSRLQGK